jgi:hypothetical protein
MWIEKISVGVLRVMTPAGPRYIKPGLSRRLYLLWVFRHFQTLPSQVLSKRQQRLIDALCRQHRFVSSLQADGMDEMPILGTVDWCARAEAQAAPPSLSLAGVRAALARFTASAQHRS